MAVNTGEARGARRAVRIVGGAAAVASRIAAAQPAWCWLDGDAPAPGELATSYLGIAAETREARRGSEREFLAGLAPEGGAVAALSVPGERRSGLTSGWVFALGYEFGVALLGLDAAPDAAAPGFALRLDVVLAVTGDRAELRGETERAIDEWLAAYGELLVGGAEAPERDAEPDRPAGPGSRGEPAGAEPEVTWRRRDDEYAAEVEACRRAIGDGEAYVLCLTDTAEVAGDFAPLDLFLRLRAGSPAPRGGVIALPGRALVSASPERFLSLRGRSVETHPIKGTRPRGASRAADERLAAELAADPKERAENLMIVDLMRNDLSRVCAPGSVTVSGFLRVETHPHVHQLVSTVAGELEAGNGFAEVIAACFPGGSMTGAPKRRAVQVLAALEAGPRGLYAGCFGWVDGRGDAELGMTIRAAELRPGRALVGAGGGITADSWPELEVAEKHLKAAAVLAALRR